MEEIKKSQRALSEETVLKFWKDNEIFKKSLEKDSQKGEYVFYEGPPTANGRPGIHHLEARAFKDAILRYKTMSGFHVARKGGWDTHGLPVEIQVEKKLNLESKKAIEEYGIGKFNKECKESVWEYTDIWKDFTDRIGFWVDQDSPYVTYHNNYIESVWSVIKEANNQNLLYKDYKVVPWCPRCGTGLSSHELAQGYQNVKDLSVYVKFKVKGKDDTFILAWTTTPWTLPGNVALAIGEEMDYVKIETDNKFLILAKSRLSVVEGEYKVVEEMKGKDLIGLEYEPLYPYLSNIIGGEEKLKIEKAFKVYPAKFVTTEDGTGVVHTAVMYGQDDFDLGNEIGLPKCHLVGLDGKFFEGTGFLEGRFVRDEDVAVDIIKELAGRELLLKKEKYEHSYPHCWRCKTALIYYARESWYIKMTALRDAMIKENEGINWEPANIKEGRFGEWLRDIKDWAISRERYWGTPLPVWKCNSCGKLEVLGGVEDVKSKAKKSGNRYFVMRHGEAENNVAKEVLIDNEGLSQLTARGVEQVENSIADFNQNIDIIISSPFVRTKQTTEIVCKKMNFPKENLSYDERIKECKASTTFKDKNLSEVKHHYRVEYIDKPFDRLSDGESFADVVARVGGFIYELENKYTNKNILIVGHEIAIRALDFIVKGKSFQNISSKNDDLMRIDNAEIKELNFSPLPHDENYELDLHKPYIDNVNLVCSCGEKLERAKEVMDVWLDSGSMPFAQNHYPFENKDFIYPADFISEGVDQTRGWFYTLHAVGNIMGKGKAFKNVICLGLILDANGKKMSKSLGNGVDSFAMIDKYGVDTLRLWMYSVNQPGEPKNFDEKTVAEVNNKIFNLLYNVIAFYELYRDKNLEELNQKVESSNILDKWIIARLNEVVEDSTKNLEGYKLLEPVRSLRLFVDDLSTWYLRRSRDRIKEGDVEAKKTLYFIFKNLAKIMAPFAPFAAEDIWQKLKNQEDKESIHLESWPEATSFDPKIIEEMKEVREIVTLGLQARQKAGIPVRQPLKELRITNYELGIEYQEILKDELNVKEIVSQKQEGGTGELNVLLDTVITDDLKQEGNYRELVRAVQDIRKKNGLNPSDMMTLEVSTTKEGEDLVVKFKDLLMKSVGAKEIIFKNNEGSSLRIENLEFVLSVIK